MADRKISDLTALTAQASGDLLPIVDVSEAAAADKNKSITIQELFRGIPVSVGVGTASPAALITVAGASGTGIDLDFPGGISTGTEFSTLRFTASNPSFVGAEIRGIHTNGGTNLGVLALHTSGSEKLRIDSSGRVGIGTSSVTNNLHVVGTGDAVARLAATSDTNLTFSETTANKHWTIKPSAGDFYVQYSGTAYNSGYSSLVTIKNTGAVGIGTSSPNNNLHVVGSAAFSGTASALSNDQLQIGFNAPEGFIKSKNSSGAPASNLGLYTTDAGGTTNKVVHLSFDGKVGIGTTSPTRLLTVQSTGNANFCIKSSNTGVSQCMFGDTDSDVAGTIAYRHSDNAMTFEVNSAERARIDSSGRLLVGTSSSLGNGIAQFGANTDSSTGEGTILLAKGDAATAGQSLGRIKFINSSGNQAAWITGEADTGWGGSGSSDYPGRLVFSTTADGASSPTERMRITSGGDLLFGKTGDNFGTAGAKQRSTGALELTADGAFGLAINRLTDDGELVRFYQATTQEGSITVSGTTVSYNGAHLARWSQLTGIDPYDKTVRPEILRGTIMSNLDELCDWTCPTSGDCQDNEQLNKTKISDVEGDKNVAGVFQGWDDDDDTWVNDFYLAMTGDFVIRIAAGTTVQRGDLLMSAGDGTAKPQDDDVIRSKTIAKVTSTNVSCTHPDGSYCVPCVLMAC